MWLKTLAKWCDSLVLVKNIWMIYLIHLLKKIPAVLCDQDNPYTVF